MESKTLVDHLRRVWPDLEQTDASTISTNEVMSRHAELLAMETGIQRELLVFRKKGLSLQQIQDAVTSFLHKNGMEVTVPPRLLLRVASEEERAEIDRLEHLMLGRYGKPEETSTGFKQMGEVYYLVYYPETGLIIIYSYSGELCWSPQ